jgi:predicted dehydrogenase
LAGEGHAVAFSRLPGVEVAAVWSRTKARAHSLASKLGGLGLRVYEDWQAMIDSGTCDVISIAGPPMLRRDPLLAALARGCHVLVEKPMSLGPAEAGVMVEAAQAATAVTACSFNWRYAPAIQTAWRAIRLGQIGAVRDIRTEWYFRARKEFLVRTPWALRMDVTNGSMGEGLPHDFDKARFLTGADFVSVVSSVTGLAIKPDGDFLVEGGRSMHLAELTGGVWGQFCMSISVGEHRWSLVVVGDEGSLWIPDATTTAIRQRYDDDAPVTLEIATRDQQSTSQDLLQHTWNRLVEDFIAAIREDDRRHESHPSLAQLSDGLRTEQVIAAARRSSTERRWVTVGD